jgi:nicotinate-nucleotide pyrophosphorylase (carboxylating)
VFKPTYCVHLPRPPGDATLSESGRPAGPLPAPAEIEDLVRRALAEDLGRAGDLTSQRTIPPGQGARGRILAESEGVLAGVPVAEAVFRCVDPALEIDWHLADGAPLRPPAVVGEVAGAARSILAAERVALNLLQHLSGVATLTARFVEACSPYGVRVLCTRKTLPGLRALERYAVAIGGGELHRAGLHDAVLIKTSHVRLAGGVTEALRRAGAGGAGEVGVEIEVTGLDELEEALAAGAQRILLDNAGPDLIAEAVSRTRDRAFLEVSGGIRLDTVSDIARLRPDAISVGAITHSAPAVDLALRMSGPEAASLGGPG